MLFDTLEGLGLQGRRKFRATAIIKDNVTDATIARLNSLGVCGARFNIGKKYAQTVSLKLVKKSMDRAREIGWHAKLHIDGDDVLEFAGFLDAIKNIKVVIDHMAHLHFAAGLVHRPAAGSSTS